MSVELLERAIASTQAVLSKVSPEQLDGSTPCASWKVRDLVKSKYVHPVSDTDLTTGATKGFSATATTSRRSATTTPAVTSPSGRTAGTPRTPRSSTRTPTATPGSARS